MSFIPAKCTQCGANITVDNTKDAGVCEYCGTAFVTEKAINNYNTYITNNYDGANINIINQGPPINPDYLCPQCTSNDTQALRLIHFKPEFKSYEDECRIAIAIGVFSLSAALVSLVLAIIVNSKLWYLVIMGIIFCLISVYSYGALKLKEEEINKQYVEELNWWTNGFVCKRCGKKFLVSPKNKIN